MNSIPNETEFDNSIFECCAGFFKRFHVPQILRRCGLAKKFGVIVSVVFLFLLGQVFEGKKLNTLVRHYDSKIPFGKDVVYRFLNQPNVNWERITFLTANAVIPEIRKLTSQGRKDALVFDDTTQYRDRSKKVEMLARCYDHAENRYYKGHTLLTMAWTDGQTLIPADYRVVSASGDKNLLEGSAIDEDNRTIATKRRKDARRDKPALVLDMLRNVKGSEADARYVLFDSWYSAPASILPIHEMGYDVVARLKNNATKYLYDGKMLALREIYGKNRKRRGASKYLLSVTVGVVHKNHESIPAKLVFVRNKLKRSEWIALICTDMSLNEDEIIALYGKRWDIEVFFKVCKSILKLGKEYQCRSFDSTCALVAVAFVRYMKLAVDSRENRDERSLGELFFCCCKELEDISFSHAFVLILETFESFMRDYMHLSNATVEAAIELFIASLPCTVKQRLAF